VENELQGKSEEARHAIMTAIRAQLATSKPFDAVHEENRARHESVMHEETVPSELHGSLSDRFRHSLEAAGGHCIAARGDAEATEAVRQIVERLQAQRIAISDSPLVRRLLPPLNAGVELMNGAVKSELFKCDVGITGAQWAIAETGTLALESDLERHRLASLVPPVHVAIIEAEKIRQTLGEVLQAIDEKGRALSRTITFITGPSRTSDIELTLAIGVHGPAELHVIVLEGARV
jgi:L-lactate dehydrogenase complex protein LldG